MSDLTGKSLQGDSCSVLQNITEEIGPGFGSRHPHAGSQPSVTPVAGDLVPF